MARRMSLLEMDTWNCVVVASWVFLNWSMQAREGLFVSIGMRLLSVDAWNLVPARVGGNDMHARDFVFVTTSMCWTKMRTGNFRFNGADFYPVMVMKFFHVQARQHGTVVTTRMLGSHVKARASVTARMNLH